MRVALDQTITLTLETFSDPERTSHADPTTVSVEIQQPDGTETTYTLAGSEVVRDSLGVFHFTYTPTQTGHHGFHWKTTGAVTTAQDGSFDVTERYDPQIVALDEIKAHLNITSDTQDDEVRATLDTATAMIEKRIGPVLPRTITETLSARGDVLALNYKPVLSVSDISEWLGTTQYALTSQPAGDTSVDSYGYDLDADNGIVYRRRSGYASRWYTATRSVTVTYRAGRSPIPADIAMAAKELVRLLWETQRGQGTGRAVPGADLDATEDMGGLRWYRVNQLLEPYERRAVFA